MLIVSERTSFQISKFNKLKLALYKALDPYLGKLNKLTTFLSFENLIIYFYLSIFLFGRSLTGVELFKFRLGELMIAGAMLMFFYHIYAPLHPFIVGHNTSETNHVVTMLFNIVFYLCIAVVMNIYV